MVLCFTFKSMIYFKLIFVKDVKFKFFCFFVFAFEYSLMFVSVDVL